MLRKKLAKVGEARKQVHRHTHKKVIIIKNLRETKTHKSLQVFPKEYYYFGNSKLLPKICDTELLKFIRLAIIRQNTDK